MRIDRFITLACTRPLFQFRANRRSKLLPILMYHSISDDPEPHRTPYYKICTFPAQFRAQMNLLTTAGYQGVSLREGLEWLRAPEETCAAGPAPVAITFDDGFRDNFTHALPVLRANGFTATFYITTSFMGLNGRRSVWNGRECMLWSEATALAAYGMELGSHTVSHPELIRKSWASVQQELAASKCEIEFHTGMKVSSFAYPFAFPKAHKPFVTRLLQILTQQGYTSCVTTEARRADPTDHPLLLPRIPVNSLDDRSLLLSKLSGHYDWVSTVQSTAKRLSVLRYTTNKHGHE